MVTSAPSPAVASKSLETAVGEYLDFLSDYHGDLSYEARNELRKEKLGALIRAYAERKDGVS